MGKKYTEKYNELDWCGSSEERIGKKEKKKVKDKKEVKV